MFRAYGTHRVLWCEVPHITFFSFCPKTARFFFCAQMVARFFFLPSPWTHRAIAEKPIVVVFRQEGGVIYRILPRKTSVFPVAR